MSADPLLLLRTALSARPPNPPALLSLPSPSSTPSTATPASSLASATHIHIPPVLPLPKSTPTRLRTSSGTAFYSLDAVYFAWLTREDGGAEYLRKAREQLPAPAVAVSIVERKEIVDWLEGRRAALDALQPVESTTPPGSPTAKLSSSAAATAEPTPQKRKYVPDAADQEFVKRVKSVEVELRDRNSVLRGGNANVNTFAELRTSIQRRLRASKDPAKAAPARALAPPDPKPAKKAKNQFPIIMISSSPTSLITMHNVKKFLEDADFIPSSTARSLSLAAGNPKPEDVIPVYRSRVSVLPSGSEVHRQLRYAVVDGVEALGKFVGGGGDPWDRVVCVMTTGQTWQFKPYKWADPRQLFHHVKGIYVQWTHDPPNAGIKDWNVTVLKIDPTRRHVDKSVVAQFWRELDAWTAMHKPYLAAGGG